MDKMTNVKAIDYVLENCVELPTDVVEKLNKIKASFEKKASADRKPSKTQVANDNIKVAILDAMVEGTDYRISDFANLVPSLADASGQKISALVSALVRDKMITRKEIKRVAYFSLATEVVTDEVTTE